MFLTSRLAVLYVDRRFERFVDAEKLARLIIDHAQALPAQMHRQDSFVDYDIAVAYKEIAAMKTSEGRLEEAVSLNRSALKALNANMQPEWLKSPLVKNNLAACYADTGLSEWRLQGYSGEVSELLHRGLQVLDGCAELMCKSRAAELEGYAGLVDWSGGHEKEGLGLTARGIHDMEGLAAADPADVVFPSAAHLLRRSYALALIASHRPDEALAALRAYFHPRDPHADAEDLLVYGEALEAKQGSESGEPYLTAARERFDRDPAAGFEPQVLRWALSRALADRADRLRRHDEALGQRREELRLAGQLPGDASTLKIFTGASAADFARTVTGMPEAPAGLREEALRLLGSCCDGVPRPYRVEHPGTIVSTPAAEEVIRLSAALAAR
jgi:hypothetical protein